MAWMPNIPPIKKASDGQKLRKSQLSSLSYCKTRSYSTWLKHEKQHLCMYTISPFYSTFISFHFQTHCMLHVGPLGEFPAHVSGSCSGQSIQTTAGIWHAVPESSSGDSLSSKVGRGHRGDYIYMYCIPVINPFTQSTLTINMWKCDLPRQVVLLMTGSNTCTMYTET